jgi:ArsR family transcriptional regulator, arsenate/arsenite/antimonite-responsive transcriptional repressor
MLSGTIRDHVTQTRRPFLRFFACGEDLYHEQPDTPLPEAVGRLRNGSPSNRRRLMACGISAAGAYLFFNVDLIPYFCNHRNMPLLSSKKNAEQITKFADMFSAMGTEPRLRIMQLLLSAHPEGMVVGAIQSELDIPNSTLSHHLDKLRNEGLVIVSRESTFLRYCANTEALQEVLQFLYAECCTRNKAVAPRDVVQICK